MTHDRRGFFGVVASGILSACGIASHKQSRKNKRKDYVIVTDNEQFACMPREMADVFVSYGQWSYAKDCPHVCHETIALANASRSWRIA